MIELILVPAEPKHVSDIRRIAFEFFREVHGRYCFPTDFPSVEIRVK